MVFKLNAINSTSMVERCLDEPSSPSLVSLLRTMDELSMSVYEVGWISPRMTRT